MVQNDQDDESAGAPPPDAAWWTHAETSHHLRVDARTLVKMMRQTPEHIERPWVNYGTPRRPFYRWRAEGVDPWWVAVNGWRTSGTQNTGPASTRTRACAHANRHDREPGQSLADYVRSLRTGRT